MRVFLLIVLIVLLAIGGGVFYVMHEMSAKPDIVSEMPEVDVAGLKVAAQNVKKRVQQDLEKHGQARLSSKDFSALLYGQLARKAHMDLESVVKKYDCNIENGMLHVKAVVDLKQISNQKLPAEVRKILDLVSPFIPDGSLENVYIGLDGRPVENDGTIDFADNSTVTLGGFTQTIRDAKGDRHIKFDIKSLRKMHVSGFKMGDDFIDVFR